MSKSETEPYQIGEITEEASEIVSEDRPDTHGDAYENHRHIADLWSAFLGTEIEAWEAAVMMTMVKASRAKTGDTERDHFRDIAGYADVAYACVDAQEDDDHRLENAEPPRQPDEDGDTDE
jgi:hypothetical protein